MQSGYQSTTGSEWGPVHGLLCLACTFAVLMHQAAVHAGLTAHEQRST